MNIETKQIRNLAPGEQPKANEGEVTSPNLSRFTPAQLGCIKMKMSSGEIKEFHMNRSERRRFIRQNHLVKIK